MNFSCSRTEFFDQVRPKETELSGFYRAQMEYFNDVLPNGTVGSMDIPNLRDGWDHMTAYAEPPPFFTNAEMNETCTQACATFTHGYIAGTAIPARNGTGRCVTHAVQESAVDAIHDSECRTVLNRTLVGFEASNLTSRAYVKFYVEWGDRIYGKNATHCFLDDIVTPCVDLQITTSYAAILHNDSGCIVDVYDWNVTVDRYQLTYQVNATPHMPGCGQFVTVIGGTNPYVYVINTSAIVGIWARHSSTISWTLGGTSGEHLDATLGSKATFNEITDVYGHGQRIYIIDGHLIRVVETIGTSVTTIKGPIGNATSSMKLFVDDFYIYLQNALQLFIYEETTIRPMLVRNTTLVSTVDLQPGAVSIGDEYMYIDNGTSILISDFDLFNLSKCFEDSLAWDVEADPAGICVCDWNETRTDCPNLELNSSYHWRAQPDDLHMGQMFSSRLSTIELGVYNGCDGTCSAVGGQCIETLDISGSDLELFRDIDDIRCDSRLEDVLHTGAFMWDPAVDVCVGIKNDQQCALTLFDSFTVSPKYKFCCCGSSTSFDCAGYPPGDTNRTSFVPFVNRTCFGKVELTSVEFVDCPVTIDDDDPEFLATCQCEQMCDAHPICSGFNLIRDDSGAYACTFYTLDVERMDPSTNTTCYCDSSVRGCTTNFYPPGGPPTPFPIMPALDPAEVAAMDRAMMFNPTPVPTLAPVTPAPTPPPSPPPTVQPPTPPPTHPTIVKLSDLWIWIIVLAILTCLVCLFMCVNIIGHWSCCRWALRKCPNCAQCVFCVIPAYFCCSLCRECLPEWCKRVDWRANYCVIPGLADKNIDARIEALHVHRRRKRRSQ